MPARPKINTGTSDVNTTIEIIIFRHKDGKQIFQGERVKFLQRGDDVYTLSILNTMPSDSGAYKVKAKNKKGYTSSRNVLNVRGRSLEI